MNRARSWKTELRSGAIGGNVVGLGFTSFFTDISSEMVTAALPAYALLHLGLSPLEFGTIDGIQRGAALLVGVLIAFFCGRGRRHKRLAITGYAISAACKFAMFAAAGVATALSAVLLVDRVGKGLRAPSRDALIAASSEPRVLATAFGLHRALDAAGALLGPLTAFLVLYFAPNAFDAIFVVSLCAACVGLACITLFVRDEAEAARAHVELRAAFGLLREPRFRMIVFVALLFALATVSESFLYVALQRGGAIGGETLPLLFAATAIAQIVLTLPLARLADRHGRGRVFLCGQGLLLCAYASLFATGLGTAQPWVLVACLGAFLAATDGVLMALTSACVPGDLRASGLAIVTAATGVGRLSASLCFGALWVACGSSVATLVFGGAIVAFLPIAFVALKNQGADWSTGRAELA
jgi:MFS family permease